MTYFKLALFAFLFTAGLSACHRDQKQPLTAPEKELTDSADIIEAIFKNRRNFPQYDIGAVFQSDTNYYEYHPGNTQTVAYIAGYCFQNNVHIRVRGRGHSMNGSSLPRTGEFFLITDKLRQYTYVNDSVIEVESGVSMHAISNWLKQYGYELPVINDGGAGPSLGGYISAGGISDRSHEYGGFWENVESVTLVDGTGRVREIGRQDSTFKWLFGSAGQLGIITKAKLKIIRYDKAPVKPLPTTDRIDEKWANASNGQHSSHEFIYKGNKIVFWLNIYAPWKDKDETMEFSHKIRVHNQDRTVLQPDCIWKIKHLSFVPPLVYPEAVDLICIGVWGYLPINQGDEEARQYLINMESHFMKEVLADRKYRRYIQTEIVAKDVDYREYLGPAIYDEFKRTKEAFDPKMILNKGFFKN